MVRHLWIIITRKMAMKPLGSGVSQDDTTRNSNKPLPRRT